MGIPGLLHQLEPYAIQYTTAELDGCLAIIDGPALAYFAHRVAAEASGSRLPSYADINAVAIRWLKSLESINIKLSAILFDGALPTSKRDERSSRLQQMVNRVTQLRAMYSTSGCPIPTQLGSAAYPFLAPALMEALHSTDFASATRIVPGEADDWCASSAREHPRSIIFTGDSDLLLYAYPPKVLVMFFKDVDILPEPKFKVYSPDSICQQLKLKRLLSLAYAVHVDRWVTFSDNVRKACQYDLASAEYLEFSRRYIDQVQDAPYIASHPELHTRLQSLDVRISEFVHQALLAHLLPTTEAPLALAVFLPLLIEDPFQTSAWNFGQDIRQLAYSLLAPSCLVIQEYKRKAQGVSLQELTLYKPPEQETKAAALHAAIQTPTIDPIFPPTRSWCLTALRLALADLKPPHISLVARVVAGDFDNTWAFIHLSACIQAILYSLRGLKQCISIWLALGPVVVTKPDNSPFNHGNQPAHSTHITNSTPAPLAFRTLITRLHKSLQTLPSIPNLFTVPGQTTKSPIADSLLLEAIKSIYTSAGIASKELFEDPKSKSQRKREKRDKKAQAQAEARAEPDIPQPLGNNTFAVLGRSSSNNV